MLKTQRNWRLSNPPGEPVAEIEDPRGAKPDLAPSLCTAVVSPLCEDGAQKPPALKSGHCLAHDQESMGYIRYNAVQD